MVQKYIYIIIYINIYNNIAVQTVEGRARILTVTLYFCADDS